MLGVPLRRFEDRAPIDLAASITAPQLQMTPLDKAVKEARKSEEARREFYNIFLRSELYTPVQSELEGEGRQ